MKLYNKKGLFKYTTNDFIKKILNDFENQDDCYYTSHNWLKNDIVKRYIFSNIYDEIIKSSGKKILDIGGGYSSVTKKFIENHDYTLLDIMSHDCHISFDRFSKKIQLNWINYDWFEYEINDHYDIIIVNDLFPNVDQRLDLFIKKYRPYCDKLVFSLTYYNNERFYKVKRTDADEILFLKALNGEELYNVLIKYNSDLNLSFFKQESTESLFRNGRSVIKHEII